MKVLITGANGFIGKNLSIHLKQSKNFELLTFNRENSNEDLNNLVHSSDFIIHLAGTNRPKENSDFTKINLNLTENICSIIRKTKRQIPIIFSSSVQVKSKNDYGRSKLQAEDELIKLAKDIGNPTIIYRLPGVFGKWCKPNYNSVVATFCYNISRNIPIQIHDQNKKLKLIYIDDLVTSIMQNLDNNIEGVTFNKVTPQYTITIGELESQIARFMKNRPKFKCDRVGVGLTRALYSTFISYFPKEKFNFNIPLHKDKRGNFVEMLKTPDSGQFSYFTANPGITRGEHYHHTKTELFLVIKGSAKFKFRNIVTNETHKLIANGESPQLVQTFPGWAHNIKNIGDDELIVMLWANEVFDTENPDTITYKV